MMSYSAILEELGFSPTDRVVAFNADDFGMCESTIAALEDLADAGIVSSASVMVPCPWFPAAAAWSKAHPGFDIGIHLTLTSEWDNYRWAPLTDRSPDSSLVDAEGYMHKQRQTVVDRADPQAVNIELQAQVRLALKHGIDLTHIDAHMYTAVHLPFLPYYMDLQKTFNIPAVLWRFTERPDVGFRGDELAQASRMLQSQVRQGQAFVLDKQLWTRMAPPAADVDTVKQMLSQLPPGLTRFYIHPAKDSPELRRIIPDWQCRVADYKTFLSPELRRYIQNAGIRVTGYRQIRDAMRKLNQ
jgi:predicted glycoside hydrolase/deacetylase ChbG (UPF0249 family)